MLTSLIGKNSFLAMLTYIWSKEAYTTTSDSVGETLIISKHNLMSVFCRASQASSMT